MHWGGTPGLRTVPQCAGHGGWDSGTPVGPMARERGVRGSGSCAILRDGSLVWI